MRGLFTCGVMDVMMEHGITFDGLVGVSAGAAFGCNYKSGQIGRAIRYNKQFADDSRYSGVKSLITSGDIFNAEFAYHIVPRDYDIFDIEAFDNSPMEYYVVCTDVESGEAVYRKSMKGGDELYEWIRASSSMPVVSRIVEIDGGRYLDGGVADSIPLEYFQGIGYERNVVVLTQPADYVKHRSKLTPLISLWLRRYPNFVKAFADRYIMYNRELEYVRQQEDLGSVLVIRPEEKLPIGHISHDREEMERVYQIGRRTAEKRIAEIESFIRL